MHEYRIHTLVDITNNGNLKRQFPFRQSKKTVPIHDRCRPPHKGQAHARNSTKPKFKLLHHVATATDEG